MKAHSDKATILGVYQLVELEKWAREHHKEMEVFMPLTKKGQKIMANMKKQYGDRAEQVFYASRNKGTISGVDVGKHRKSPHSRKG